MLQEGSSIADAIKKAWAAVGQPQDFSIKVLQAEETSFFGFIQSKPAIVSISYDPATAHRGNSPVRRPQGRDHQAQAPQARRPQNSRENGRDRNNNAREQRDARDSKESPFKPFQPKEERPPREQREPRREQPPRSFEPRKEHPGWSDEFVAEIVTDLRDILRDMKIGTTFSHAAQKQQLMVTFAAPLFEESDLEKMFYASLAHLLLQLMKRRHRQAFSGYRLLLTNAAVVTNADQSNETDDAA